MGRIYSNIDEFEKTQEDEFRNKVIEIAYYQGDRERITLDGEWTESELKDDVYNEAHKILCNEGYADKYRFRAMIDSNLIIPEYITTHICDNYDVIEVYNRLVDMHRNDEKVLFGIHYFDDIVRKEVLKVLKNNLINN